MKSVKGSLCTCDTLSTRFGVVDFHCLFCKPCRCDGPPSSTSFPLQFTETYQVVKEVGKGAFGWVYKVRDRKTRAIYAAKLLENNESNKKEVGY